jgi:hypothetical protein
MMIIILAAAPLLLLFRMRDERPTALEPRVLRPREAD